MTQPIARLYDSQETANQAVNDLHQRGFSAEAVKVISGPQRSEMSGDDAAPPQDDHLRSSIADAGVPPEHARVYADHLGRGQVLVLVYPNFGFAQLATHILQSHNPQHVDLPVAAAPATSRTFGGSKTTSSASAGDPAAPLSAKLGLRVLLDDPAPLSSYLKLPVLKRDPESSSTLDGIRKQSDDPAPLSASLGLRTLSDDPAPLSSRAGWRLLLDKAAPLSEKFGWRVLSDKPAPLSEKFGWRLLSDDPAPLSSKLGWRLLSDNPTPLSSWLGLRVLLDK